jgi:hypothetical protein
VVENGDVLLLIALPVLGALLTLRAPAAGDIAEDPGVAQHEPIAPMVERGLDDLNVFLERHSAFAAYLQTRDASGPTPE